MKHVILLFAIMLFAIQDSLAEEALYRCSGIYQNKPCAENETGSRLDNLPRIGRYESRDLSDFDSRAFGRPRPEVFEDDQAIPFEEDQDAIGSFTEPIPQADDPYRQLASDAENLRLDLDKGLIAIDVAEGRSIHLRGMHDTICSDKQAISAANAADLCEDAQEDIQEVALTIQEALMR